MKQKELNRLITMLGDKHQINRIIQLNGRQASVPQEVINDAVVAELIFSGTQTDVDSLPLT